MKKELAEAINNYQIVKRPITKLERLSPAQNIIQAIKKLKEYEAILMIVDDYQKVIAIRQAISSGLETKRNAGKLFTTNTAIRVHNKYYLYYWRIEED